MPPKPSSVPPGPVAAVPPVSAVPPAPGSEASSLPKLVSQLSAPPSPPAAPGPTPLTQAMAPPASAAPGPAAQPAPTPPIAQGVPPQTSTEPPQAAPQPAAPLTEAPPPPSPPAAKEPSPGTYLLRFGAFAEAANAASVQAALKRHGYPADVVPAAGGGRTLAVVQLGGFTDRTAAAEAAASLQRDTGISALVIKAPPP
jgi:cell division protein FtsN